MAIDPTFGRPFERFMQVGSFVEPAPLPTAGPFDAPLYALPCVNNQWLRLLLGSAYQLTNPSSWDATATDAQRLHAVQQAQELMAGLAALDTCVNPVIGASLDGCILNLHLADGTTVAVTNWAAQFPGCVRANVPPPPANPRGTTGDQFACNLAGFIATEVIQAVVAKAAHDQAIGNTLQQFAMDLLPFLASVGFVYTAAFADVVFAIFSPINSGNNADFASAGTDPVLQSDLTCAIFSAIRLDGQVTGANFPTLLANICAISYTHPEVIAAICNYVGGLGAVGLQSLEVVGALVDEDCSSCGGWCFHWDFTASPGTWFATAPPGGYGSYVVGVGFVGALNAATGTDKQIDIEVPFPAARVLTAVDITYQAFTGDSGHHTYFAINWSGGTVVQGWTPIADGVPHTLHLTGGPEAVTHAFIRIVTDGSTQQPPVISAVTFHGQGVNPFGTNNCT